MVETSQFPDVQALAHALAARQRLLTRGRTLVAWTAAALGLGLLGLAVLPVWLTALPLWLPGAVLLAAWLGGVAFLLWRARADDMRLVSAADLQVSGFQQLPTTLELERREPANPFLPLLRKRCEALLHRVDPSALIPFQLDRRALWTLGFAAAAFGLFLLPSSVWVWTHTQAALHETLLSEEGQRLEKWAERLKELAEQQDLPAVRELAEQVRQEAKKLQNGSKSTREAIEKLQGLAQMAEDLAQRRHGESRDAVSGAEPQHPDVPTSGQEGGQSGTGTAGTTSSQRVKRPELRGPEFFFQDPGQFANTTLKRAEMAEKGDTEPFEQRRSRAVKSEGKLELQVLERAKSLLSQSATEIKNRSVSQANNANAGSKGEQGEAIKDQSKEPMSAQGQLQDGSGAGLFSAAGPSDPAASNRSGEAPSQSRGSNGRDAEKPGAAGYKEQYVKGSGEEAGAEEYWVRQLPTLNARHVRADGSVPAFQQGVVTANTQGAIPRAYRSVVRSYFLRLDQLNESK
jgi:hypothetical protein